MTVRTPTIVTGRSGGPFTRDRVLIAGGLAVALVTILAVVVWQTRGGDEAAGEAPATTITEPVPQAIAPPTTKSEAPEVVIVGSQEAAERLQMALTEADTLRGGMGLPPLDTQVIVATTEAEAEHIVAVTHETNLIRAQSGLPEMTITDLR
jgi:hypothetical protein